MDLGPPIELAALGLAGGMVAAVVTSGDGTKKVSQIGGYGAAGLGLGMLLDGLNDASLLEGLLGGVLLLGGVSIALTGGSSALVLV
jgi:hypothetical protein